jgi:hypothetical protein
MHTALFVHLAELLGGGSGDPQCIGYGQAACAYSFRQRGIGLHNYVREAKGKPPVIK